MPRREGRLQTEIKEGEMNVPKVAINRWGRIERVVLKIVLETPQVELAAVNDLMPVPNRAYLMKYDSVSSSFRCRRYLASLRACRLAWLF